MHGARSSSEAAQSSKFALGGTQTGPGATYSVDRQADFSVESSLRFRAFGEIDGKQGGMAERVGFCSAITRTYLKSALTGYCRVSGLVGKGRIRECWGYPVDSLMQV